MAVAATLKDLGWKPPIDEDTLLARKLVNEAFLAEMRGGAFYSEHILNGTWDDRPAMQATLAGIRAGRASCS
jgi:hypothetical protein